MFKIKKCLVLLMAVLVLPAAAAYAERAMVTGKSVNVREGPGMEYEARLSLKEGTEVEVTDASNALWYAIKYDGGKGYMSSKYLRFITPEYSQSITFGTEVTGPSHIFVEPGGVSIQLQGGMAAPVFTDAPVTTAHPVTSTQSVGTPAATAMPVFTAAPVTTMPPVQTAAPITTAAPVMTPAPVMTMQPVYTDAPVRTAQPELSLQQNKTPAQDNTSGYITGNYVRFRTGPSTSYSIIRSYNKNTPVIILERSEDWIKCIIDETTGFVSAQYVSAGKPVETLQTAAPVNTSAPVATTTPVYPLPTAQVTYSTPAPVTAPVPSAIPSPSPTLEPAPVPTATPEQHNAIAATGQSVADFAQSLCGSRYSWAGQSPETGFDCSGLVWYVYSRCGYTLNRVAADQAKNGVHTDDLQPGDILCFYSGTQISHVGIYIGNDSFVHSANSATGVVVTQLSGYYSSRGYEARRIIV